MKKVITVSKKKARIGSSIVINHQTSREKFLTVEMVKGDIALFNGKTGRKVATRTLQNDGEMFFEFNNIRYNVEL